MSSNKNEANEAKSSDTTDDDQLIADMLVLNDPDLDSLDEPMMDSPLEVETVSDQPAVHPDISDPTLDNRLASHSDRIIMEIDTRVATRLLKAQQALTLLLESVPRDPETRDERTALMARIDKVETSLALLDRNVDGVAKTLDSVHDCTAAVLSTLGPVRTAVLAIPPMQQSVSRLVTHMDTVTDILKPAVTIALPEIQATVTELTQKFDSFVNNTDTRLSALHRSSDGRHAGMAPPVDDDSSGDDDDDDEGSYMSGYHGLERQGYKTPGPGPSTQFSAPARVTPNLTQSSASARHIPLSPYGTPYLSKRGASASSSRYPPLVPLSSPGGLVSKQNGSARSLHEDASGGIVNWLENSKGPYLGGVAKTFKAFSVSLTGDGFDEFFRFYNACVTQLDIAGYHRRLLPSLDDVAPDVDLTRSPIRATCMPVVGDHAQLTWTQQGYWDQQHANLSQLLYLTLTSKDVVKPSAPLTLSIINRHSQHSNGFGVLQGLLRRHHPRVSLSTAPQFANVLTLRPTFSSAHGSHATYLGLFERWLDRIRLHSEYGVTHKPSKFSIWFIQGLSGPLRSKLQNQENILLRFQAFHKHEIVEPDLLPETAVNELGELLDVIAPEATPVGAPSRHPTSSTAAMHPVPVLGSGPLDYDHYVADYEHYVAAFGGAARQGNLGGSRGRPSRSTLPSAPCPHAPCRGRSHPPDLCCICHGTHIWDRCWHLNGLPAREQTRCSEYKALKARGDPSVGHTSTPITPAATTVASIQPSGLSVRVQAPHEASPVDSDSADPLSPAPVVDDDVQDIQRDMHLREAPHLGSDYMWTLPPVHNASIHFDTAAFEIPTLPHVDIATPSDDIDDSLPADTVHAPIIPPAAPVPLSEPVTPPPPGHVWWHVDTGATDSCTHVLSDLLAPIPTYLPMGTAAGPVTDRVEAIGSLTLSATDLHGRLFHTSVPQVLCVPNFIRRSFSLHHFLRLGYNASHNVGRSLTLTHLGTGIEYTLPVETMNGNTDFVALRTNNGFELPRVSAINLASRLKGPALYYLLHFRMGCLSPFLLDAMIKNGRFAGVPATLSVPPNFQCPICLVATARKVSANPGKDHALSVKGARLHGDFLFPKVRSVRGYVSILILVEPVTSHGWVFLRRSKHPPIQLLVWFITHIRRRFQWSFSVLRTDGGGELYGSLEFRSALAQVHVNVETTGGYNSAANGPAEHGGGLSKQIMRCLLVMGGQPPEMWCFAAPYAQLLLNIRPRRKEDFRSSHYGVFGAEPSYDHLRILFSMVYVLISRASRRSQDPIRRATPGLFLGFQGTGRVLIYRDAGAKVRYAHHAVIDELQSSLDPLARNPAAQYLHHLPLEIPFKDDIAQAVDSLEITPSRWSHATLTTEFIPSLGSHGELGVNYVYSPQFSRCQVVSLVPDSPAAVHLLPRNLLGRYLLAINGCTVRTSDEIRTALINLHSIDVALSGITLLLGKPSRQDHAPEDVNFVPADGNIHRSVWSIISPHVSSAQFRHASPAVYSIEHPSAPPLRCPLSFKACMKGLFRKDWLAALFKHLDSNQGYNSFQAPCVPPPDACILDTILAIKHKTDEFNRLVERKVRLCAHGGQQIAGLDYDESYAPAILSTSFRLTVLLACHLGLWLYHLDVSNAFQSTVDHDPKTYLRCFPEYLLWYEARYPTEYVALRAQHPDTPAHEFAMLMLKFVQGRVDASRQWKHAIEEVLIHELGLVPNRADTCMYSGRVQGEMVIIGRATDDFLVASTQKGYKLILHALEHRPDGSKRWSIHDYGLAQYFFGIRIVQSADAITIDQRPFTHSMITEILGGSWTTQTVGPERHKIPLPSGSSYEARLAGESPASASELSLLEQKFNFKFRTLLGKFMQLTSWTRVDLVTATTRIAQYQTSPGSAHFEALHSMLLYLRAHPDDGLTFTRKGAIQTLETLPRVSSLAFTFDVCHTDALGDPVATTHDPSPLDSTYDYASIPVMHVPRVSSVHFSQQTPPTSCASSTPISVLTPPPTEGEMDANHGSVFETVGFSGIVMMGLGTVFYFMSKKQATSAYNTAESELYAATEAGKFIKWLRVWMSDMGIPYTSPIPMGEDNEAARIIGHAGKLTRNVRHIAIQTTELQSLVNLGLMALRRVGSADNKADHCTKLLAAAAFLSHVESLMGIRFITPLHAAVLRSRNIAATA